MPDQYHHYYMCQQNHIPAGNDIDRTQAFAWLHVIDNFSLDMGIVE